MFTARFFKEVIKPPYEFNDESTRRFIKKDAVVSIDSEGLMGNKILVINPGTGGKIEIRNNDTVATIQAIDLDDLLMSLKSTIENTSDITSDLSEISFNIQSGKGTVGRLLMDQTWRQNFDSTLSNLKEGSSEFRTLMVKANTMDELVLSSKATVENTANITSDVSKITSNMESGKGTMGRLFMDQSWKQDFDSTLINLKESSASLRILMEKAKGSWLLWGF